MKCPYQTMVIYHEATKETYSLTPKQDVTTFCECLYNQCPFYVDYGAGNEKCRRAEKECE